MELIAFCPDRTVVFHCSAWTRRDACRRKQRFTRASYLHIYRKTRERAQRFIHAWSCQNVEPNFTPCPMVMLGSDSLHYAMNYPVHKNTVHYADSFNDPVRHPSTYTDTCTLHNWFIRLSELQTDSYQKYDFIYCYRYFPFWNMHTLSLRLKYDCTKYLKLSAKFITDHCCARGGETKRYNKCMDEI